VLSGGDRRAVDRGHVCGTASRTPPFLPRPELYTIATGTWSAVALAPSIAATCAAADDCQIRGVGRHWLAVFEQLCNHCASRTEFQSLATGGVRPDPTAATTLPDLNSPTLANAVCSPLRLPASTTNDAGEVAATLGSLDVAGRFALATSTASDGSGATYLERCGSRLHSFVCRCSPLANASFRAIAANAHVVIWAPPAPFGTAISHLDGLYLPSRRRFLIPLPAAARGRGAEGLQVSSRSIYIENSGNGSRVFRAPIPR
jgi:hypothetical protein